MERCSVFFFESTVPGAAHGPDAAQAHDPVRLDVTR
jgi:hypothetical protein